MKEDTYSKYDGQSMPFSIALSVILLMWLAYTVLTWQPPPQPWYAMLSLVPGTVSIAVLYASGVTDQERFLRFRPLSRSGFLALVLVGLALLPILVSGTWQGWNGQEALIYGPASAVAQELFFRATLLAAFIKVLPGRTGLAIVLQAMLFVLWHAGTFKEVASFGVSIIIGLVLFTVGLGWGWATLRDRSVFWTTLQHALFLFLMSMYSWGSA